MLLFNVKQTESHGLKCSSYREQMHFATHSVSLQLLDPFCNVISLTQTHAIIQHYFCIQPKKDVVFSDVKQKREVPMPQSESCMC